MKLLREPLMHFLALGGLLFGVFAFADYRKEHRLASRIDITPQLVLKRSSDFQQSHGHPPSPAEMRTLIDDCVREEVLVREARQQGIDEDDAIIRNRLRQRMEQIAEEQVSMPVPSEGELLVFLNAHANEFKTANGPTPLLSDIRETVLAAWHREQRRVAADVAYQKIRRRYDIVIDPSPGSTSESP